MFLANATRIKAHLLGGDPNIRVCTNLEGHSRAVHAEIEAQAQKANKKRKSDEARQGDLREMFGISAKVAADRAFAEMFYATGLPFSLTRSKYFAKFVSAV